MLKKKVRRKCPMMLPNGEFFVDLLESIMLDFDVIMDVDGLHTCFASVDCRMRVVKFNFPDELIL